MKGESPVQQKAKSGAKMVKMAKGGIATSLKAHAAAPASKAHGMRKGGSINGIAVKGKTKGKMV